MGENQDERRSVLVGHPGDKGGTGRAPREWSKDERETREYRQETGDSGFFMLVTWVFFFSP